MSEFQPVPITAEELAIRWAQRDAEYAKQGFLDMAQAQVVREARMREAGMLPDVTERARMFARAQTWTPPVGDSYGSMKDWLE